VARVLRPEAHVSVVSNEADELGRVRSLPLRQCDAGSSNKILSSAVVESILRPPDKNEPGR